MDDRTDSTRLLTDLQVARRFGLSFHTLRKLRVRGGGPPLHQDRARRALPRR